MTWPIPAEGAVADRYRRGFEAAFGVDDVGNPLPDTVDTSPSSVFGVIAEVADETHTELYLYQRALAQELMPDTATYAGLGWLARHGAEWGVPQLRPTTALGAAIFAGAVGAPLPAGIEVSDQGQVFRTQTAAVIGATGTISIPIEAEVAGAAGNRAAGATLTLVSAVAGLTSNQAIVDVGGLSGGTDLENPEAWRARILARIRTPGAAGAASDYAAWAAAAGATYTQVVPRIVGPGSVGVYVALPGPIVPSATALAAINASMQALRPVTADLLTLAATLLPVNVTLALSPDTVNTRAAATLGLRAFFLLEGWPGRVLPRERLDLAIAASSGEYTHLVSAPAADVAPAAGAIPTLGVVTFTSGAGLPPPP